ncbi:MAG TPA: glucose PTS transporter subunit IIA [Candidatus Anaerostipes excrementavium]|uniref:Glucose PTS transporter subunit IIA n=1 Tax=Candidatus Anaerostipes excrementavium TaxID=2838463 RepID=A0A9D1WUD9_9FIRM|nr:glucose PTS transporter subunit IIA [uncultured Anaerostipes sp.]HIX67389.1 glucose PTS transporter subunit IIA [Candidatus Anaerostipes excrementavium]
MKYENEAQQIIENVGGKKNIVSLVHCATRLRFTLKDNKRAKKDALNAMPEVISVVISGGQYQVVVGSAVADYYAAIVEIAGLKGKKVSESTEEKGSLLERVFAVVSGGFSPLIPAMAGAGMLKALLTVLTNFDLMSDASSTYAILSAAGNSVFYFLPIFLGITLAIKLGANPYVGGAIGAALLEPSFTALIEEKSVSFLQIPVTPIDYASTVFPIFVAMAIYAVLHKFLSRIVWKDVQLFVVPMISLILMVPLTAIIFGPFGTAIGDGVSQAVMWLIDKNRLIAGIVLGGGMPFMVVFGLHWGFTPITLQNLADLGGDPIEGAAVAAVFAEIGIAIGMFLKAKKHSKERALAGPCAITGLLAGVTEPIVYGIIMNHKSLIPIVAVAGGIGGGICGAFGVTCNAYVFHNIFAMPVYTPFIGYIIGVGTSLVLGIFLTYFIGMKTVDKENDKVSEEIKTDESFIYAPIQGKVVPQEEIPDPVFASGTMGFTVAIEPEEGQVCAPFHGIVETLFPTKHAIGLVSDDGKKKLLIHIGMNTVELDGKYFKSYVQPGDMVEKGQRMVEFDMEKIKEEGYPLITPICVVNSEEFEELAVVQQDHVDKGQPFIKAE